LLIKGFRKKPPKARRDGKIFYYINDGVYHTFSGVDLTALMAPKSCI